MARSLREPADWFLALEEDNRFIDFKRRGIEVWSPRRKVARLVDGVWKCETEEVTPGYFLLRHAGGPEAIEALGCKLLRLGGRRFARLTRSDVFRLKESECVLVWDTPTLRIRQRVRVSPAVKSSYSGMYGVFQSLVPACGGFMACVSMEALGDVVLPPDHLEAADNEEETRNRE